LSNYGIVTSRRVLGSKYHRNVVAAEALTDSTGELAALTKHPKIREATLRQDGKARNTERKERRRPEKGKQDCESKEGMGKGSLSVWSIVTSSQNFRSATVGCSIFVVGVAIVSLTYFRGSVA